LSEQNFVTTTIQKLEVTVNYLEILITQHFNNNTNYDRKFYMEEKNEMEVSRGKFNRLKANLDRMNSDINESEAKRAYVIE
jgi:hypothetical protein